MKQLWYVVWRELKVSFWEHPKNLLLVVGLPVLYVFLFGNLYGQRVINNMPTVIYDQDQTDVSRRMVQAFEDSEKYNIIGYVDSQEAMEWYLYENKAQAAVVIPSNFARDVKKGIASQVLLIANGGNLMYGNAIMASANEVAMTMTIGTAQQLVEAKNNMLAKAAIAQAVPVEFRLRLLHNPTYSYLDFMLIGLMLNGLQIGLILVVGTGLIREYPRLHAWHGIPSYQIVCGKMMAFGLVSLCGYILTLLLAVGGFGVPCRGSLLQILLMGMLFIFAIAAVGSVVSAVCPDEVLGVQLPVVYIMPAFVCCGYLWPRYAMEGVGWWFSSIIPLTYSAETLRDIMLTGYAVDFTHDALILFIGAVLLTLVAVVTFGWRRKRVLLRDAPQQPIISV